MTIAVTDLFDATGSNVAHLPAGWHAGYMTGSWGVPWTSQEWAAHPGAVRIDQSPVNTRLDEMADVLDMETGAATIADVPGWSAAALGNFRTGARPGQRSPAIYVQRSRVTEVVNALIKSGIKAGIGLGIAAWNNSRSQAAAEVANASGPFPVVWRQYRNNGLYDSGVASVPWLTTVSGHTVPKVLPPPGQWLDPAAWTWQGATLTGLGLDGKDHSFGFNPAAGSWSKVS